MVFFLAFEKSAEVFSCQKRAQLPFRGKTICYTIRSSFAGYYNKYNAFRSSHQGVARCEVTMKRRFKYDCGWLDKNRMYSRILRRGVEKRGTSIAFAMHHWGMMHNVILPGVVTFLKLTLSTRKCIYKPSSMMAFTYIRRQRAALQ